MRMAKRYVKREAMPWPIRARPIPRELFLLWTCPDFVDT